MNPSNEIRTVEDVVRDFYFQFGSQDKLQNDIPIAEVHDALRTSIVALLKHAQAEIARSYKAIDYDKYCGCDGECFANCKRSMNAAKDEDIAILESVISI